MTKENDINIPKLLDFVRKHQTYKNQSYRVDNLPYDSVSKWIETETIAKGAYPVRGSALHKMYKDWCEVNNIDDTLIAKSKSFHSIMKEILNYHLNNDNLTYYISKKVNYEPQKNNDQAAQKQESKEKS
jgi:hypothetical protein